MYCNNQLIDSFQNSPSNDLSNIPVYFANKGDVYYFVYSNIHYNAPSNTHPRYKARLYDCNIANVSQEYFESSGYVIDGDFSYLNDGKLSIMIGSTTDPVYLGDEVHIVRYLDDFFSEVQEFWNNVGPIEIEFVSNESYDIVINYIDDDYNIGMGYINGVYSNNTNSITIYRHTGFQNLTYDECYSRFERTIVHEVGHALKLGHIDYNGGNNIMYSYGTMMPDKIGQGDLAVYRYLWG